VRDSTDRREAILEAALVLFAERGFHGTAVPLVAEKAEVGAGTIYRYFESKEALVNVLYQRWKGRLLDTILDNFPFHLPMREQFRMFWRRWATFVLDNPTAAIFLELHHHAPYLDAESRAIEERVVQAAALFFDEARKQRLVRDVSTPLLLAVVHGLFVGIIRAHFEGRLVLDDNMLTAAETCCWEAIRA
jgi:AcrR family transcriptional regulator